MRRRASALIAGAVRPRCELVVQERFSDRTAQLASGRHGRDDVGIRAMKSVRGVEACDA